MPYLIGCKNSKDYQVVEFSETLSIGRAQSNDIVLDDPVVSRKHAYIEVKRGSYVLVDQSKNGTLVDGNKIDQYGLSQGRVFQIVDYFFTFLDDLVVKSTSKESDDGQETADFVWDGELETKKLVSEKPRRKDTLRNLLLSEGVVIKSEKMVSLFNDVRTVAGINIPVLILGESGTGKEIIARILHRFSEVRGKFIPFNCSAVPESLFEGELFGSVRGAFSDAVDKPGKLELANNGTFFLDEIGDLSLSLQPKLLRFTEDKELTRLGDIKTRKVDVRLVAATNQDLNSMMEEGTFRRDFYQRLACVKLVVPALRERKEDVAPLTEFFLSTFAKEYGWKTPRIANDAMEMLIAYDWPNNVRELKNVILNASLFVRGKTIYRDDLATACKEMELSASEDKITLPVIKNVEKEHIIKGLEQAGWNKKLASKLLGISRGTLYRKMKEFDISKK
jgi:transcriptional regulator with PAS, ATPase and Fis domain